jgi:branched-chain amino acid transport system permease protein
LSTLRLREDYFAILTLGFAEALRLVTLNASSITRGPFGIPGIPRPFADLVGSASYAAVYLAMVVAILLVALFLCIRIAGSPLGRTLRAIRDEPDAAMAVGKNPLWFRLIALLWGAALAALAGSLWAHYVTFVAPQQFTAEITFYAWIAMIVGGVGSMIGGVVGTAVVVLLVEGTRFLSDAVPWIDAPRLAALRQIVVGIGLIALTVREYRRGVTLR